MRAFSERRSLWTFVTLLADGCRASPHSSPRGMQRLRAVFRTSTACLLVWCNRFHDEVIWSTHSTVICFVPPFLRLARVLRSVLEIGSSCA